MNQFISNSFAKKRKAEGPLSNPSEGINPTLKQPKLTPANGRNNNKKAEPKNSWHQNQQSLTRFIPIKKQFSLGTGAIPEDSIIISSWNINGLRAITARNDLQNYFNKRKPDILCLSETKTSQEAIDSEKLASWIPPEYTAYWNCSKLKKGYSGTAVITKYKPLFVEYGVGLEKYDNEGRLINLEFEAFNLVACYVPMSGDDFSKLPNRLNEWDPAFRTFLEKVAARGKPVIVCGDLNVAHEEIDVWGEFGKWAGTSPEERKNFGDLLESGYIDTWRHLNPGVKKYSWWSTYLSHRPVNKGRRYDYILVSKDGEKRIKEAHIDNDAHGSDHCPVELVYELKDLEKSEEKKESQVVAIVETQSETVISSEVQISETQDSQQKTGGELISTNDSNPTV